jgi:hypothetical protein
MKDENVWFLELYSKTTQIMVDNTRLECCLLCLTPCNYDINNNTLRELSRIEESQGTEGQCQDYWENHALTELGNSSY